MIYTLSVRGIFDTNCYFDIDDTTNHGFLIDPGAEGEKLVDLILEHRWVIEAILLTHGHFDHFGGVPALRNALDLPVMIHEEGRACLEGPELNLSRFCGGDIVIENAQYFRDGDTLSLQEGGLSLRVLHTPGHTNDSCVLYDAAANTAFVGDTIFKDDMGNPNYPTGNQRRLLQSIRNVIMKLPEETLLCSGHSAPTTVGRERHHYF